MRAPPRPTLFPTRRSSDLQHAGIAEPGAFVHAEGNPIEVGPRSPPRSEEHTSELQSHSDLVCRLLLEKKKEEKPDRTHHILSNAARISLQNQAQIPPLTPY